MLNQLAINEAEINGLREIFGEGQAATMAMSSSGELYRGIMASSGTATMAMSGSAEFEFTKTGEGSLTMAMSSTGDAMVDRPLERDDRKLGIGVSEMVLFVRGEGTVLHNVYSDDGIATMTLSGIDAANGVPQIPGAFEDAHFRRRMVVPKDNRLFVVPKRRSV